MEYDINAALKRLEKNLQDLDSARKQVEETVNASNELCKIVREYVKSVKDFRDELFRWAKELRRSQGDFSAQVQNAINTLKETCDTISVGFKSSTDEILSEFSEQNKILTKRVDELKTVRQELREAISEIIRIRDVLSDLANALLASQQEQTQILEDILGRVSELPTIIKGHKDDVVQQMDERHRALIQKVEDSISKTEYVIQKLDSLMATCANINQSCDAIKTSVSEVKSSVVTLQKSLSKSININRWILIGGIIILAALHFI